MKPAAVCRGCGEEIWEGAFCYRLGAVYWCRSCVADSMDKDQKYIFLTINPDITGLK